MRALDAVETGQNSSTAGQVKNTGSSPPTSRRLQSQPEAGFLPAQKVRKRFSGAGRPTCQKGDTGSAQECQAEQVLRNNSAVPKIQAPIQ